MPEIVENYTPRKVSEGLKKKAFQTWGIVLFIAAAWTFMILLAPFAAANELHDISNPIYSFFGYICHQISSRSFHILEHQFAVCSRCTGIYFGLFLGLAAYPFFRSMEEIEPFPRFWLFLAMLPMAVDWSLTFFEIWENTHFTRVMTGLILGFTCAVFIVPALVEFSQIFLLKRHRKMEKAV